MRRPPSQISEPTLWVSAIAVAVHLALALVGKIDADFAVGTSTVIVAAYVLAHAIGKR